MERSAAGRSKPTLAGCDRRSARTLSAASFAAARRGPERAATCWRTSRGCGLLWAVKGSSRRTTQPSAPDATRSSGERAAEAPTARRAAASSNAFSAWWGPVGNRHETFWITLPTATKPPSTPNRSHRFYPNQPRDPAPRSWAVNAYLYPTFTIFTPRTVTVTTWGDPERNVSPSTGSVIVTEPSSASASALLRNIVAANIVGTKSKLDLVM